MLGLDVEDLLAVGLVAVGALIIGQFIFPRSMNMMGIPMNWFCFLVVVLIGVPGLMIFKYGKPRGYLMDYINWQKNPKQYDALAHDPDITGPYIQNLQNEQQEQNKKKKSQEPKQETIDQIEKRTKLQAACRHLPIRDYLDNVMVRLDGCYVAGYRMRGALTYFATDEDRNELKARLDALIRACPEESMRIQIRYEVNDQIDGTLEKYVAERRASNRAAVLLDEDRVNEWHNRAKKGEFLSRSLAIYLIWDPNVHRRVMSAAGTPWTGERLASPSFSISTKSCITQSKVFHDALLAQFESILRGIESSMMTADLGAKRMTHEDMFLELQETTSPFNPIRAKLRDYSLSTRYVSAREQLMNVGINGMTESYVVIDRVLWSVITFKAPPEQTWPGLMRELQTLGFPLVINTHVIIPNQTKVLDSYRTRQKKMIGAQTDHRGNYRVDVQAKVAAEDLENIQARIMSSSTKACSASVSIAYRTSFAFNTAAELEKAERQIADRREHILQVISRMEGATGLPESVAQMRILFGTFPGLSTADKREMEVLSSHAADFAAVEMPWAGTEHSSMMLFTTPYRQIIPFSPFDPSLENANALIVATSGSGKSMLVQKILMSASRQNMKVSILESGDSYQNTVRYMGGQMITISLDSPWTINPFDLEPGVTELTKEHRTYLINLIRHMIGESPQSDPAILSSVLETAIEDAYKRASVRPNPIPTLRDVKDELYHYHDANKQQLVKREAELAEVKLRAWVGDGVYASLFDRHTTVDMNADWIYFNIEKLKDDAKLESAMSFVIAYTTSRRASGRGGNRCMTILDECWKLLESPCLEAEVVSLFRTARKRDACVVAISQAVEDFTGTPDKPKNVGPAILANTAVRLIGRQKGNVRVLKEFLHMKPAAINYINNMAMTEKGKHSEFLISVGEQSKSTHPLIIELTSEELWNATTYPREKAIRSWWLFEHRELEYCEAIRLLAKKFPRGCASLPEMPEERSGEVKNGAQQWNDLQTNAVAVPINMPAAVASTASVLDSFGFPKGMNL
jgi:hypothetical protein